MFANIVFQLLQIWLEVKTLIAESISDQNRDAVFQLSVVNMLL